MSRQIFKEFSRQKALAATLELRSLATQVPRSLRRILRRAAANELRIGLRLEGEDNGAPVTVGEFEEMGGGAHHRLSHCPDIASSAQR